MIDTNAIIALTAVASLGLVWHIGRSTKSDSDFVATMNWLRDLREWASEAVTAMSEARQVCQGMAAGSYDAAILSGHRTRALVVRGARSILLAKPARARQE